MQLLDSMVTMAETSRERKAFGMKKRTVNHRKQEEAEPVSEEVRPPPHPALRSLSRSKSLFFEAAERRSRTHRGKHLSRMNSFSSLYSIPEDGHVAKPELASSTRVCLEEEEETRVFHRSPVSFANGYRKVEPKTGPVNNNNNSPPCQERLEEDEEAAKNVPSSHPLTEMEVETPLFLLNEDTSPWTDVKRRQKGHQHLTSENSAQSNCEA